MPPLDVFLQPNTEQPDKLLVLTSAQKEGSPAGSDDHVSCSAGGPMTPQIPWCLKCQWQVCSGRLEHLVAIGESQCRPVGFGSKFLLPFADNYCPFEKHHFTCYWALVEAEHLTWPTKLRCNLSCPS